MKTCEYPNSAAINTGFVGEDKGIARLLPGLSLRALNFYEYPEVIHALQLNYYEVVLWRRWLCDCPEHQEEEL